MAKARTAKVKADLADLVLGVGSYHTDRGRLPLPVEERSDAPIPLKQGSKLLALLLGENVAQLNPARQPWISPRPGSNGAGGLVGEPGSYGYLDPWGEPYYLVFDADYNDRIANPDRQNTDRAIASDVPAELFAKALALSAGPDRELHTRDDIVSWR